MFSLPSDILYKLYAYIKFSWPLAKLLRPRLYFKVMISAFSKDLYKNSLMKSVCCRDGVDTMLVNLTVTSI